MGIGPCLCGDTYCPSCGDPVLAAIEAAAEWLMEELELQKLSADEYKIVAKVGIEAVKAAREAVAADNAQRALGEAESRDRLEAIEYLKTGVHPRRLAASSARG